ncbi:tripartite tricarboxylate transporter TctB family protein [Jannaschia rubra]|uniref:Tripartite tricarboxylate transporter TctB family protein n=1 Tax=Jannaschia rubra TaxID=282197 RepID=A0A0M6XLL9_9RHOB|nr:tripartite tricarboxylate transporter TctB family protein [Jannaschia rubra]CTQ32046.1 Tripartite tricarboxylate transporter TctB family protein [Jannaschia rubra]SFG38975.1 putative tricarboxylic transport membrane protein [Jannaschia rubra]
MRGATRVNLSKGKGDRLFGVVVVLGALAYANAALNLQVGFLTDPVGSKTFPLLVAGVCLICGLVMVLKPDPDPKFPSGATWGLMAVAVLTLVAYAYMLKPLGFLLPTTVAAAILSYLIEPRAKFAALAGIGLSIGLFVLFRFVLGLGLVGLPRGL